MKIHEYQSKKLLSDYGIPVPRGGVAKTPAEAREVASQIGGKVVVKAQVHAGGRGLAGGIKTAESPEMAEEIARSLIGTRLVTHQTSPEGVPINAVLVEEAAEPKRELYLSVLIDTSANMPLMMASEAGGMEIEEVAAKSPEKIHRAHIDPLVGFQPFQARALAYAMNLEQELVRPATQIMTGIYRLFKERDLSLAEINPLVITADDRLLALDAKINIDDNGLFRQKTITEMRDASQEEPLETQASDAGVNYIKLDGMVGCLVNGAGLAMATMDVVKQAGAEPANFLDIGGGATEERVTTAFRILASDPNVKTAFVNLFGGITRCDEVAKGIINAAKELELKMPIVVRMRGTNYEEGLRLLAESGLNIVPEPDLTAAARKAVEAAKA